MGASDASMMPPSQGVSRCHGGHQMPPHDTPTLFFGNLVKYLITYHCKSTSNIDIYPSILEICINNLLKPFLFGSGPPTSTPRPCQRAPHPPENHTSAQYFQQKPTYLLIVNVYIIFPIKCIGFWHKIYLIFVKVVKIKNAVSCFITEG